jgi:hypothetical protein
MRVPRLRLAALALASGIVLSGCAYDTYGDPYGYGYGPYSGVSVGIGYGGGYGGYGYPYGGYGYGGYYGGYDPFGWYGDYYYPGSGIYVYDRYRTRHRWNDDQRRYWQNRRDRWQQHSGTTSSTQNWSGWDRSHWRNSTSTSGSWDRSNWRDRSPERSSGVRVRSSDDGVSGRHHSHEGDERPQ